MVNYLSKAIDHILELGEENGEAFIIDSLEQYIGKYNIPLTILELGGGVVTEDFDKETASRLFYTAAYYEVKNKMYLKADSNLSCYVNINRDNLTQEVLQLIAQLQLEADRDIISIEKYDYEEDEEILFTQILKNIASDDIKNAQYFFEVLRKLNKNVEKIFGYPHLPKNILTKKIFKAQQGTADSLVVLIQKYSSFFETPYYYEVLSDLKNTSLDEDEMRKIRKGLYTYTGSMEHSPEFEGISYNVLYTLRGYQLYDKEELEKLTKEELLSLNGIGKKTVETLEKNGVEFRKE